MGDRSYYDWCLDNDMIGRVRMLLERGGYHLRDADGKIVAEMHMAWEHPWHHVQSHGQLDCHTWHKIMFDVISMSLPADRRFVPSECQNCFKVVVRPQSLKQLFALLEIQKKLGRPAKCGIETRDTVHGLYGGYFYNRGLEEGLECYAAVREAVDADKHMGADVPVILKRGCTEFEHAIGPSDKWEITEEQIAIEKKVNETFVRDVVDRKQPDHVIAHIHRSWIEFAWKYGDPTYAEFTGGKPIAPPYVTYHHLLDKQEDNTTLTGILDQEVVTHT